MRRTTMLLAAVLLASLTACGSRDDARYAAANPKTAPTANKDGRYLKSATGLPYTEGKPTDQELLAFPPKWCDGLAAGHSVEYLFDVKRANLYPVGEDWGLKLEDANELLITAVNVYCPEHRKQVLEELRPAGGY